jgi:hypothetical protein
MRHLLLVLVFSLTMFGLAQNKMLLEPDASFLGTPLDLPWSLDKEPSFNVQQVLLPYPDGRVLLFALESAEQGVDPKTKNSLSQAGAVMMRFSSNGQPDFSFNGGKVLRLGVETKLPARSAFLDVLRASDGRLTVIGTRTVRRYLPNGSVDLNFFPIQLEPSMGEWIAARLEQSNVRLIRVVNSGKTKRVYTDVYSGLGKLIKRMNGATLFADNVRGAYLREATILSGGGLVVLSEVGARAAFPALDILNPLAERIKTVFAPGDFNETCGEIAYGLTAIETGFAYSRYSCGLDQDRRPRLSRFDANGKLLWEHAFVHHPQMGILDSNDVFILSQVLPLANGKLLANGWYKDQGLLYVLSQDGKLESSIADMVPLEAATVLGKVLYAISGNKIVRYKINF